MNNERLSQIAALRTALAIEEAQLRGTRTTADPLTIAYIALGAVDRLKKQPEFVQNALSDNCGGELGVVANTIEHALMADAVGDFLEDGAVVWPYDVCEVFGARLVLSMLESDPPHPSEDLKTTLIEAGWSEEEVVVAIAEWKESRK